jgi:ABC-type uncharacterized transport system substrate-binding protein
MYNRTNSVSIIHRAGILLLLMLLSVMHNSASAAEQSVAVIYQEDKSFSVSIARELAKRLRADQQRIELIPYKTLDPVRLGSIKPETLIVTLGSETTHGLFQHSFRNPVFSLLVSKQSYKTLLDEKPAGVSWSALYIDQPLNRQLSLIRHLLGDDQSIGVLLGPYSRTEHKALQSIARRNRQSIRIEEITDEEQLIPSLKSLTDHSSVLLAIPDPMVFNKTTIRGILLLSYRENIPMIGFSRAYVKAGAIAAIYTRLEQISEQAYQLIRQHGERNGLPRSTYYPDDFSVAVNRKVARTLEISVDSEDELIRKIKADEARR